MGHGQGYLYPHAYRDHWVAQQYLPTSLVGRVFWQPSDQGYEGTVRDRLERRREAQLAAMVEEGGPTAEPFSAGPTSDRAAERWLQRAHGSVAGRLEQVRALVFDAAAIERHHVVLECDARTGLLVWEAVRRTPEGHVWAAVRQARDAEALAQQAGRLDPLRRPKVVHDVLSEAEAGAQRFDRMLGRDVLARDSDGAAGTAGARGLRRHRTAPRPAADRAVRRRRRAACGRRRRLCRPGRAVDALGCR
jgi:putative ATPase